MASIPPVADAVRTVLTTEANRLARESGFVQRDSKLGGAKFAQTLVFGWLANPAATLEELAQTAATLGVAITPQGLDQRRVQIKPICREAKLEARNRTGLSTQLPA